jgi:hypothetical protein
VNVLTLLDAEFQRTLKAFPERAGTIAFPELAASVRPSVRPLLLDAVRCLARLDSGNLPERFRSLLRAMEHIAVVQKVGEKPDGIYPAVFQQNRGQTLLSTFLVLNNFAMKETAFTDLCSDFEKRIWVKLEAVVLIVLRSDPTFLKAYITLQEQFAAIAAAQLR